MRKGFTIIEMMLGIIILSLLLTALYRSFSASRQGAKEIMANQQINDEFDLVIQKIIEDVRESNYIYDGCPPEITKADLATYKTEKPENYLMFMKVEYDFTKDPMDLPDGTYNYTQTRIRYFLEKEDETDPDSLWVLNREMLPYDNRRQPINSQMTVFPVLDGISECLFYRLKDPDASRSGNLYIKLKMTRNDKKGSDSEKYTNETLISVKERGSAPDD
ncbi:MAG: hypothetical protein Kow0029_16270 [Candidatus Rifleibacteriota bacterium]